MQYKYVKSISQGLKAEKTRPEQIECMGYFFLKGGTLSEGQLIEMRAP